MCRNRRGCIPSAYFSGDKIARRLERSTLKVKRSSVAQSTQAKDIKLRAVFFCHPFHPSLYKGVELSFFPTKGGKKDHPDKAVGNESAE